MADSSSSSSSSEETLANHNPNPNPNPNPPWKITHLLKPSFPTSKNPQISQIPSKPKALDTKSLNSTVNFHGWRRPLEKWTFWVQKLLPKFESSWKKNSIFHPIMASTFEIPRCYDTLFALAERWCPETNSFLLPWGEVTITLEDIMVLGGFSVLGDSVLSLEMSEEMPKIEFELERVRKMIVHTKAKKASQKQWMNVWMGEERKFEHEAFLVLWLSRYVMPSDSVTPIHFPIAIQLAKGVEFALAPAILASIYRDLRLLKHKIESFSDVGNLKILNLWAPLQLLQIWVWERFPKLSPTPNLIIDEKPRLAKWHKVKILKRNNVNVNLDIDSSKEGFQWRPYLNKSSKQSSLDLRDLDLQCYARLVRVSYLVGFDKGCTEPYLPDRVSMQFGFDQDVPGVLPKLSNNNSDSAWNHYNRLIEDVESFVPSRLGESESVTKRKLEWWNNSNSTKEDERTSAVDLLEEMRIKLENKADVPPGFEQQGKRIRLEKEEDADNVALSQFRAKCMNQGNQSPACSEICPETPFPSAQDDAGKKNIGINEQGEDICREVTVEDGIENLIKTRSKMEKEDDDDDVTLSQFQVKPMNKGNQSRAYSESCPETPLTSAGDNEGKKNIGITAQKEHTCREFIIENGTENDAENKTPSKSIEKKPDIVRRISRLEKIVGRIKKAQIIHL